MSSLSHYQHLPRLRITPQEFMRLPEYSCSYPTGTTPGKRWRREDGAYDQHYVRHGGKPVWMIGEYDPDDDGQGKTIKINWFLPVFRVQSGKSV